jgi:hypothetical protein
MASLFLLLFFVAIIALVVGLINPRLVVRWGVEEKRTRGKAALTYGVAIVVLFIAFGIASDHEPHHVVTSPSLSTVNNPAPAVSKPTTAPVAITPAPATAPAPVANPAQQTDTAASITGSGTPVTPTDAWKGLNTDQQRSVRDLYFDTSILKGDIADKDVGQFASDLETQEKDVATAKGIIEGGSLSSKDSVQNVIANAGANEVPSGEVYRMLVYSMKTFDSAYLNPSSGDLIGNLAAANNASDDILTSLEMFGYSYGQI